MKYDMAIVGGGFYGVHIAIKLSELNYSVVIIEKEDDQGSKVKIIKLSFEYIKEMILLRFNLIKR